MTPATNVYERMAFHEVDQKALGIHLCTVGTGETITAPFLKHRLHLSRAFAFATGIGIPPKVATTLANGRLMMRPHSH